MPVGRSVRNATDMLAVVRAVGDPRSAMASLCGERGGSPIGGRSCLEQRPNSGRPGVPTRIPSDVARTPALASIAPCLISSMPSREPSRPVVACSGVRARTTTRWRSKPICVTGSEPGATSTRRSGRTGEALPAPPRKLSRGVAHPRRPRSRTPARPPAVSRRPGRSRSGPGRSRRPPPLGRARSHRPWPGP